jgi:hydrogenase expression/formation protein HypE
VAVVAPHRAEAVLAAMRAHPLGRSAACVGEVVREHAGAVVLRPRVGGARLVPLLQGEQLPRIC